MLLLPALAGGQEAIFNDAAYQRRSVDTRSGLERMPYSFRIREFRAIVKPTLSLDANDNIYATDEKKRADVIISPWVDFHAVHPIGENNQISLDLGLGYTKYVKHHELDRLMIAPGTALDLDFAVGQVGINVHDRLTYQLDPTLVGAVAGVGTYGGLDNTAGLQLSWELHRAVLSAGYDYLRFIAESDEQSYLDRSTHAAIARGGVELYPGLMAGAEGSAAPTTYDDSFLNDNTSYSAGAYGDWNVTDRLHVVPRGGYTLTTFTPNSFLGAQPDYSGFYFGFNVDHRPNELFNYRLSAERQIRPGVNANLTDAYAINLAVTWNLIRGLPFTTSVFFEDGQQTGGGRVQTQVGVIQRDGDLETWRRYGGQLRISHDLTERLRALFAYGLTVRDGNLPGRDYLQNRVTLTFAYRL